ncbi:MAG: hypothetical protein NTU59_01480 [Coprothermobacterota bacterium]|nr:hypothetical protein [Coprothermobacterota bacterium]
MNHNGNNIETSSLATVYMIQRRLLPDDPWSEAGMAVESQITRTNREHEKEREHTVIAVNKASEGEPSDISLRHLHDDVARVLT